MSLLSLTCLDVLTILLSLYVIFESFTAVTDMAKGYIDFCQKVKYGLAFATSCALVYYAFRALDVEFQWLIFGMAGTLAAFMWPRVIWRLRQLQEEFERYTDWG